MENIFFEITVVICVAAVLSGIFRLLKQPALLAYILTGILIGPLGLFPLHSPDVLKTMAEFGITLLLFMMGLEIRLSELPIIGRAAILTAVFQIISTASIGFVLASILGLGLLPAIYVGIALSFSSTIIVVKLLSDKKDLRSLYGKISVGVLLIQDFVAILLLIFLSNFNFGGDAIPYQILIISLKAVVLFGWIIFLSNTVFPKIVYHFAKSQETLFLLSLAWVFGLAAFVSSKPIGFSIEIGGFLAGLALSNSVANYQIIAKVKILRDFFIVLFFVLLGLQMNFGNIASQVIPALVLAAFVVLGKPLLTMFAMGFLGFRKRTSFFTGLSLSQMSEFSLILIFTGQKLGQISQNLVSLLTLTAVIAYTASTYLIIDTNKFYFIVSKYIPFFERAKRSENINVDELGDLKNHIVIIGGEEMGRSIMDVLEEEEHVVLVDFNPEVVKKKDRKNVHRLFGDIIDTDIQDRAQLGEAKLIVSTISDMEDNALLIRRAKSENKKAKVVVIALDKADARVLYKEGADYVVLPHLAGGRQIAKVLRDDDADLKKLREKDFPYIS